jgi:hypothetical protein
MRLTNTKLQYAILLLNPEHVLTTLDLPPPTTTFSLRHNQLKTLRRWNYRREKRQQIPSSLIPRIGYSSLNIVARLRAGRPWFDFSPRHNIQTGSEADILLSSGTAVLFSGLAVS